MPFHTSRHKRTYTHTRTQEQRTGLPPVQRMCISRTTGLPLPMQPMIARRGDPSSGPGPLCRRMALTGCHPQISSAPIESVENAEISPALISTTAVRKYVFKVYLLWKSMQRTLRSKVGDKKACLRHSFPHLLSSGVLRFGLHRQSLRDSLRGRRW
jgi:hypothetical protein